jgi:hypothetical protein
MEREKMWFATFTGYLGRDEDIFCSVERMPPCIMTPFVHQLAFKVLIANDRKLSWGRISSLTTSRTTHLIYIKTIEETCSEPERVNADNGKC